MNISARRLVLVGAFAVAAAAAPVVALSAAGSQSSVQAQPPCLAWFGNKEDGKCLSYSNSGSGGGGVGFGSPGISVGSNGVNSGPLLPGQTWNVPIG
ncbi:MULTISPECIES: hypothetical protein [unclassified Mycolicibacterium]|uniref:DUF7155 family protein n=1 Tax=unclassified Mycolicibacterium TaxID=2636767 RepID=UPI00224B0D31|nr:MULTISPECIES: hypothetical protein [unclassified Mycolicibacterium]MCX2711657.1 hypothetical protein [Mycolicibacterium sp. J2]MDX1873683.1 hypothetical protein [Mycolicibacterium sp. 120266]